MSIAIRPRSVQRAASAAAAHGVDVWKLSRVLCDLGDVRQLRDLGANGPLLASAGKRSLFHCLFGRDAIRMALDLLEDFPAVARATLLELARLQGVRHDPRAEEEPGRILHEHRLPRDPLAARLGQRWSFPYYGAVDSTPQWVNLLAAYAAREADTILDEPLVDRLGRQTTVRESLLAALRWILGRLDDRRGAGYLWVCRASPYGIANQVWEDSSDSHYDADGTLFEVARPYAPIAVQGYVYDALLGAADLLESSPAGSRADVPAPAVLRRRAAELRARVLAHFWQPDLATFALALTVEVDGTTRPARVVASSPGHLLASRLLDGSEAAPFREPLIARLLEHDLLAGAGVRTRSTTSPRFRAGSYHNGSTWPMDTGVIADGLRRHGRESEADELDSRVLRACAAVGGFPEFFRGEPDGSVQVNSETVDVLIDGAAHRLEQPPQDNQGWTVTRVWHILRRHRLLDARSRRPRVGLPRSGPATSE